MGGGRAPVVITKYSYNITVQSLRKVTAMAVHGEGPSPGLRRLELGWG